MPLSVVTSNRGKDYSIFEKLNPFVEKLVGAYKQKKQNEWDAEWQLELLNIIDKPGNKESSTNLLANVNPPKDYIDIEGATNWAKETMSNMSMVMQKEIMTGGVSPINATPKTTDKVTEQPEMIPDKMEWNTAFKMISELAPGKTDWSSLTAMFRERIESGKAMGTAAQQFLNMIMGEGQTNQRAELGKNIDMTDKFMSAFYPEAEEAEAKLPTSEMGLYLTNREVWQQYQLDKEAVKPQPTNDPNYQIVTITDKEGVKTSYYVNKDDPEAPATPIKGLPKGQSTTTIGETKKIVPTYGVIETISEDLLNKDIDYDTALSRANVKYDLTDPNIKLPQKADRAKKIYDFALVGDEEIYGIQDADVVDKDGFIKDDAEYKLLYSEYEQGAKEYYEATGKLLPKKYLSLEESGKYTSLTAGTGYKGGYKPVLNEANIPWNFAGKADKTQEIYNQMIQQSLTLKDMDLEALSKDGVDINRLLQMFNQ